MLMIGGCVGSDAASKPGAAAQAAPSEAAPGQRRVCPQCVEAGGETSDFGDGSAFLSGGAGQTAVPSPCEQSTTASPIELDAARALGFDEWLDRLEASFELPLDWTSGRDPDRPARGYQPRSRLRGTTTVLSAEHAVPSLEGCNDSLAVRVGITFDTEDGTLSIAGTLHSTLERDARSLSVFGWLDLSQARGTLELDPPPSPEGVLGYVRTLLYVWPDSTRVLLTVGAMDARDIDIPFFHYFYEPLEGIAPLDDCSVRERPIALDEATPTIGPGQSLADHFPELLDFIARPQPFAASWTGGAQTTVEIGVGEPLAVCDDGRRIRGLVPYRVQSGDGRVSIDSEARMSLAFDASTLTSGWFEIYHAETLLPAASFAERTGISGVDFGQYGGGLWHTELYFEPAATHPLTGEVTVDAVDIDGNVTGTLGAISDSIDGLGW